MSGIRMNPLTLVGTLAGPIELRLGHRGGKLIKKYGNDRDAGHYQRGFGDGYFFKEQEFKDTLQVEYGVRRYGGHIEPKINRHIAERTVKELQDAGEKNVWLVERQVMPWKQTEPRVS